MQRLYHPRGSRRASRKLSCLTMVPLLLHSAAAAPMPQDTHHDMPAVERRTLSDVIAEEQLHVEPRDNHSDLDTDSDDDRLPTAAETTNPTDPAAAPILGGPETDSQSQIRTHLAIGFGTAAGVFALLLLLYLLYRFRRRLFPRRFPPPRQTSPGFDHLPEKSRELFGTESFTTSTSSLAPALPQPALALSTPKQGRHPIRSSLLSKTRFPIAPPSSPLVPNDPKDARTWLLDENGNLPGSPHGSILSRVSRTFTAPIPESPEAAHMASRFSWTTHKTGTSGRPGTSGSMGGVRPGSARGSVHTVESSTPRFKGVNSWVGSQAGRVEKRGGHTRKPSVPLTPKELRMHPGAEVKFGGNHGRMESRVLDMITPISHPDSSRELMDIVAGMRGGA